MQAKRQSQDPVARSFVSSQTNERQQKNCNKDLVLFVFFFFWCQICKWKIYENVRM